MYIVVMSYNYFYCIVFALAKSFGIDEEVDLSEIARLT